MNNEDGNKSHTLEKQAGNEPGLVLESDPFFVDADSEAAETGSNGGDDFEVLDAVVEDDAVELSASKDIAVVGGGLTKNQSSKARFGDRLVEQGIITDQQLQVALEEQKLSGTMLGEALVKLSFIEPGMLTDFLAESTGFEVFDAKNTIIDSEALAYVSKEVAKKFCLLPLAVKEGGVQVAMADPYDVVAMDSLRSYLPKGANIIQLVTTPAILEEAIDAAYGYASNVQDILKELEKSKNDTPELSDLTEEEALTHPIVRLVNALLSDAVKKGVSDLHFEPEENFIRLRYRLDGVLYTAQTMHKRYWNSISQRLKIMAQLNIADKLAPQDGRIDMIVGGRGVDFRVSSLPTVNGENIVLRVLDKQSSIMPLQGLGFSEANMKKISRAQERPEGVIIVTGPTGSGKSTSLYSMLNEINTVDVNIQTLEDPVEYSVPQIRQTAIREGILDFADGIRALLRQDPDIIFVGEIRDGVTGNMALKAAMTGHQVYTTLHTNDSFGALPRLFDLGLKPGMVAGAIIAVFAQRLVRRLCLNCRQEHQPDAGECHILGVDENNAPTIYRGRDGGCDSCAGTGYKGRTAIVEILSFDDELDDMVADNANKAAIKAKAIEKGFKSLRDDGILKVLDGITSLEALARVVDVKK